MYCLIPKIADAFKEKILSGEIDPLKLAKMTSEERRTFFSDHLGGEINAREVNALFEGKLLLKNQQLGMINWAKQMLGEKSPTYHDVISKIERMDKVLDATSEKAFLEDLASKKLGTEVTFEEAKAITEISQKMKEAESKITPDMPDGSPERLEYGAYQRALKNYVDELKLSNEKPSYQPLDIAENVAGFAKGIKASLDNSALFRQGWKTLFTDPGIWAKNAVKSFSDITNSLKDSPEMNRVLDGTMADIVSRKNALNGNYRKMKLDIGQFEEAFPTTLPEKIPVFGRLYKASEVAYNGFLRRMRADIADKFIEIAEQSGVDIRDKFQMENIGRMVNSLTGRGNLGIIEPAGKFVNNIFFSPKMLKSQIDFLTMHSLRAPGEIGVSPFVRKQAAINLLKVATGMATILGVAKVLNPKSVETDPRSSDFGKIRIGDTRFDMSGGMSSLITLASRIIAQSTKSSTSGKITELNTGEFGKPTGMDMVWSFFENKFSPAMSLIKELAINRSDFEGKPITPEKALVDAFVPLPITNAYEVINNPKGANALLTIIADGLGISTNTYSPVKKKK